MTDTFAHLMSIEYRMIPAVLLPLIASALIFICGNRVKLIIRGIIAFAASACSAAAVYSIVPHYAGGEEIRAELFSFIKGAPIAFSVDEASIVLGCTLATLWVILVVYYAGYMKASDKENRAEYLAAFVLSQSAASGVIFAANVMTLAVSFIILVLASFPVIIRSKGAKTSISNTIYAVCGIAAGLLVFIASIITAPLGESTNFIPAGFINAESIQSSMALTALLMLCSSLLVLTGIPAALTPGRSLMHAATAGIASVFCVFRAFLYVFGPDLSKICHGTDILAWIAVIGIVVSVVFAFISTDINTKVSYAAVMQLLGIVIGTCLLNPFSTAGTMFHMTSQVFIIAIIFMSSGAFFASAGRRDITRIAGAGKRFPVTMGAFGIGCIAIAGLPPFAGFAGLANMILGAVTMGKPIFAAALIAGGIIALVILMPVVLIAFNRKADIPYLKEGGEVNVLMLVPVIIAVIIVIVFGFAPNIWLNMFELAIRAGNLIYTPLI